MSEPGSPPEMRSPWHEGEQELQRRMGTRERMEQLGRRLLRAELPEEHRAFYPLLSYLIVGSRDATGQPWASILWGAPGFVTSPDPRRLRIEAWPAEADPLAAALRRGVDLGLLGIDLSTRRRNRANGQVLEKDAAGFTLGVRQSFGNCPRYIHRRELRAFDTATPPAAAIRSDVLGTAARALVAAADTFFLASASRGSSHDPAHGLDASHRGGAPGFVRVEDAATLVVPDHPGNGFFNTLGNLRVEPRCGLLFLDFERGDVLQVSAEAEIVWREPAAPRALDAERWLRFRVREVLLRPHALPLRFALAERSTPAAQPRAGTGVGADGSCAGSG